MIPPKLTFTFLLVMLNLTGTAATAADDTNNAKQFGEFTVHYNAFTTDSLQPNMAKAYNITRSKNRGLLTVSVMRAEQAAMSTPAKATIQAKATNLTGQLKDIRIREIDDGSGIYYVSEFHVADKEVLDFTIHVSPENDGGPHVIKFRQQFFTQ